MMLAQNNNAFAYRLTVYCEVPSGKVTITLLYQRRKIELLNFSMLLEGWE